MKGDSNGALTRRTLAEAFSDALDGLFEEAEWENPQRRLAELTGKSHQQISNWRQHRPPGRDDVDDIAIVLYQVLKAKKGGVRFGQKVGYNLDLESILGTLLGSVGLELNNDIDNEPVWSRLAGGVGQELKLGWFVWRDLTGPDQNFQGPARLICERLCDLLGVRLVPVQVAVEEIGSMILNREIDIMGPFLKLPARRRELACSKPILGLKPGINFLARKERIQEVREGLSAEMSSELSIEALPFGRLRLYLVRNGVPHILLNRHLPLTQSKLFADFREAWEDFSAPSPNSQRVEVFVADELTCLWAIATSGGRYESIFDGNAPFSIPMCFGVNPSETQLLAAINDCLEIMHSDAFLWQQLERSQTLRQLLTHDEDCPLLQFGACPLMTTHTKCRTRP